MTLPVNWIPGATVTSAYLNALDTSVNNILGTTITQGGYAIPYLPGGSGAVLTTVGAKLARWIDALDFGADPTGVADSTTALQNAITYAAGTGTLVIPHGTYKISSTLTAPNPIVIVGYGATLLWGGANPGGFTPMIKIGNGSATTEQQVSFYRIFGLTVDGNSVGGTSGNLLGFYFTTSRYSTFSDLRAQNLTGTGNGYAYYCSGDDTHQLNVAQNGFYNLTCENVGIGMSIGGTTGGTTVNTFVNFGAFSCATNGIIFVQNCDTNYFFGTNVSSLGTTANFTGIIFNNGANKTTQDNDVHEECFTDLVVTGGTGTTIGCLFNYAYNIRIRGLRLSANSGTLLSYQIAGPTSAVSFTMENTTGPFETQYVSPPPTAVAGAGAGTSPPAPVVVAGSNAMAGTITFGTGTGTPTGAMVTVTFPFTLMRAPASISLQSLNGATNTLVLVPASVTATGFVLFATSNGTASEPNNFYQVSYTVTP